MKTQRIWSPTQIYERHRIPGMIVTARGTLIVYTEARREFSDWGEMDILLKRSTDGGESFGEPIVLANGNETHKTVNNPTMVEDRNGRIHLIYCEDYSIKGGRVLHRFSDDDGITWSTPDDITYATAPEERNVFAVGPGHGICTPSGDLILPIWRVPKRYEARIESHVPSEIGTLYSKDDGITWQMGEILPIKDELFLPNETEIALLEDGSVYLNCRLGAGLTYRGRAYSKTGFSDWTEYEPDKSLYDPICFGSVISYKPTGKPHTLIFVNCDSKYERKNITVKGSTDGGKTWTMRRVIDSERGGYAELAVDRSRGNIYVLYEEDAGVNCYLCQFNYEWLEESRF